MLSKSGAWQQVSVAMAYVTTYYYVIELICTIWPEQSIVESRLWEHPCESPSESPSKSPAPSDSPSESPTMATPRPTPPPTKPLMPPPTPPSTPAPPTTPSLTPPPTNGHRQSRRRLLQIPPPPPPPTPTLAPSTCVEVTVDFGSLEGGTHLSDEFEKYGLALSTEGELAGESRPHLFNPSDADNSNDPDLGSPNNKCSPAGD
jgi:hypothetical protein